MPAYIVTYRDYLDPTEPSYRELLEARDQEEAMELGQRQAQSGRQVVGIAPSATAPSSNAPTP